LQLLELFTGKAVLRKEKPGKYFSDAICQSTGRQLLLSNHSSVDELEITADHFENSNRKVVLVKVRRSYQLFRELIRFYAAEQLLEVIKEQQIKTIPALQKLIRGRFNRTEWTNVGGQLMENGELNKLITQIKTGKLKNWDAIHQFYSNQGQAYPQQKFKHAIASLFELNDSKQLSKGIVIQLLKDALATKEWMVKGIYDSRAKDYTNPFRKMVYASTKEMEAVTGKLNENSFILQQQQELKRMKTAVQKLIRLFN
jgi:hypothetical protein